MIGLIFGEQSENTVTKVRESHGLKGLEGFSSIGSFLSMASRKALRCERLIINCVSVNSPQEFYNLRTFLLDHSRSTEVVLLGRFFEASDLEVVDSFYQYFTEPIYTDYLLQPGEQVNVDLVANNLCKASLDSIRLNHSSRKDIKAVVKYGSVPEEKVEVPSFVAPKPVTSKAGVLKTFGYGGKFFGKKKLTNKELERVSAINREVYVVLESCKVR